MVQHKIWLHICGNYCILHTQLDQNISRIKSIKMDTILTFKKRCGDDPHSLPEVIAQGGSAAANNCPDVWELSNGESA